MTNVPLRYALSSFCFLNLTMILKSRQTCLLFVFCHFPENELHQIKCLSCFVAACDEGPGICAHLLTFFSIVLVFITIPFSLCFAVKVNTFLKWQPCPFSVMVFCCSSAIYQGCYQCEF